MAREIQKHVLGRISKYYNWERDESDTIINAKEKRLKKLQMKRVKRGGEKESL